MSNGIKVRKEDKKAIVENRMKNTAREWYNQVVNLKLLQGCNGNGANIEATQNNIKNQEKAYEILAAELKQIDSLDE